MESKYIELFTALTRAVAVTAEQVMEYDHNKNDEEGYKTAETMRNDFEALHDKLSNNFDGTLTKSEYAKLLVGSYIISNNIRDKMQVLKKSAEAYEKELIPKLQKIVDAPEDSTQTVADEILTLEDNK